MKREIEEVWQALKAVNDDVRELQVQVARLNVQVADARATIETMRNSGDPRAPIPIGVRRGS